MIDKKDRYMFSMMNYACNFCHVFELCAALKKMDYICDSVAGHVYSQ